MVVLDALTGLSVLCAALILSSGNAIIVISVLLVLLSVFGAFETPTVQACIPSMLTGDNITKGNAVVNQIASLAYLIAPMLGSILYTVFGLKPVMYASIVCFFLTAIFECFIKLDYQPWDYHSGIFSTIKEDFLQSMRFIFKDETDIVNMLGFTAVSRFFVMGITMVGLPYIVRNILGLNAQYYGMAESTLAVATILGSLAAGLLVEKIKSNKLSYILSVIGVCIVPSGIAFLLPVSVFVRYIINIISFCGMQIAISIFSIYAVSIIQQKTPNYLIGKVMAYTSVITLCVQPVGQIIYGYLFDEFCDTVYLVLIPSGIIVCIIGVLATGFFRNMGRRQ